MFNLNIIKYRKIWLSLSGVLVVASILALFTWGLNFGIDFTGGSLLEVEFKGEEIPSVIVVRESLEELSLNSLVVQPTESGSVILRFKEDSHEVYRSVLDKLGSLSEIEELRYESVGPSIGKELKNKSFNTMILVLAIIILYIALVFKKVSRPVSSWKYGIASVVALAHNIIIVLGVFSALGHFCDTEINAAFIAAILTILGYSVNDTIVIFDRIRENLPKSPDNFETTVNRSINQSLTRSINTSFTTLLALLAIIIFGGSSIRDFVLALAIGIFVGAYSSIFIASPILVWFEKRKA